MTKDFKPICEASKTTIWLGTLDKVPSITSVMFIWICGKKVPYKQIIKTIDGAYQFISSTSELQMHPR